MHSMHKICSTMAAARIRGSFHSFQTLAQTQALSFLSAAFKFKLNFVHQVPEMSSWSCSRCTFLNSPSQTLNCKICLFPSSSTSPSSSSNKWSCSVCTFLNPNSNTLCAICDVGNKSSDSSSSFNVDFVDLEPDELSDPNIGSMFLPLRKCGTKREAEVAGDGLEDRRLKKKVVDESFPTVVSGGNDSGSNNTIIKILTYNVWFREDVEVHKRMKALGDLIQQHSPEVVCFQEVTPYIYELFQNSAWWNMYKCSLTRDMVDTRPYFCMQMSKFTETSFKCKPFPNSVMGRELLIAEIDLQPNKKLTIATTHLESPAPAPPTWNQMYSKERILQAKESIETLKIYPNVVFGGDMNWNDKQDGRFPLMNGWIDAWNELKSGENGWTYDTVSNKMLTGGRKFQTRLDRFVCCLKDFRVVGIEMIGKDAVPGASYVKEKKVKGEVKMLELPVLPSDHYGLLLTVETV